MKNEHFNRSGLRSPAVWLLHAAGVFGLAGLCFFAYQPALDGAFLNWDDNINVVDNQMIRSLDAAHVTKMFTTTRLGHYQPLTWLSYAVDCAAAGGLQARTILRTNIIIHWLASVICFAVAGLLIRAAAGPGASTKNVQIGALFAAAVFAIHPLRAESVAWATERRDVLSGLFYLSAIWIYLRSAMRSPARRPTVAALAFCWFVFCAALLSKVMSVSLPAVLLVLDVYPLRRVRAGELLLRSPAGRRAWLEKLPFFAAGIAVAAVAMSAQTSSRAALTFAEYGPVPRVIQCAYSLVFYAGRSLLPVGLSPLYELPAQVPLGAMRFLLPLLVVVAVTVALVVFRRRWPAGLAAWVAYGLILVPVSGLFQNGPQITADRYSYLSCIAFALLVGGGVARLCAVRSQTLREFVRFVVGVGVVGLFTLTALARRQTHVWGDAQSVWSRVVAVEPNSVLGHNMMGELLADSGALDAALKCFEISLERQPNYAQALHNMGNIHLRQGRTDEALASYQAAWAAYQQSGGSANLRAKTQHQIGSTLHRLGRIAEAAAAFKSAVALDPERMSSYANLAACMVGLGRPADAVAVLQHARQIDAADANVNRLLAWIRATSTDASLRDGAAAVRLADAANQQTGGQDLAALETLAAAYAEAGRFDDAIKTIDRAVTLAQKTEQTGRIPMLLQQRALYSARKPMRAGG